MEVKYSKPVNPVIKTPNEHEEINFLKNQLFLPICILFILFCFQLESGAAIPGITGFYQLQSDTLSDKSKSISGTITDEGGQPLSSVIVEVEKYPGIWTSTDVAGNFTLKVPIDASSLTFSYPPLYESKPVDIKDRSIVNLELKRKVFEETLAVGYGIVKESDLTGSITSVRENQTYAYPSLINAYPTINVIQALQGRAAGVDVQATNGEPGSIYKVRVRGATSINASSDPIYVVDGFVGAFLPPAEDIASIEILKDASSTAIYGSRGANGVVLISTKNGKLGEPKIELNTSYSAQQVTRKLDLLNAEEFIKYRKEIEPGYISRGVNTDWQNEIFRTGGIQNYQLSFSGGTENLKYYLSGNYWRQKGLVLGSQYNRFSILSKINTQVSPRLNIGLNIFAQRLERDVIHTQELNGGTNNAGVISAALNFEPDQGLYDASGNFTLSGFGNTHDNPFAITTERLDERVTDRMQGYFSADYTIIEGSNKGNELKFKSTFGGSIGNGRNGFFIPTTLLAGRDVGGIASISGSKNTILLSENYFTYSSLSENNKHEWSLMAGYSFQGFRNEQWLTGGQNFLNNSGQFWNMINADSRLQPESELLKSVLASWYSRFNYSLSNKYVLTLNARKDGSSTFSKSNKWAYFPSGALAWNIHEEEFMQDFDWLNQFKIRMSYGITGNQAIAPYQTLASLTNVLTVIDGSIVNAVGPFRAPNNELTWETTAQWNIGADLDVLDDRFILTIDYYRMKTSDLLLAVQPVEYSGYGPQLKNVGEIENRGLELTIHADILKKRNFNWSADFTISGNRNKILKLPDNNDIFFTSSPGHLVGIESPQVLRVGEPMGVFYGWVYEGVNKVENAEQLPGSGFENAIGGEKYLDFDGSGKLDNNDRKIIGDPNPDFIWSLNNDFHWKKFDLNIFFLGAQGNEILSYTLLELDLMTGQNNTTTTALNRWTTSNTETNVPKTADRTQRVSTRWIFDGSYVRLKNISLGYSFPEFVLRKLKIRNLRCYISAQNILTITDYKGFDPEVNYNAIGFANGNRNLGLDYGSYPRAKSFTFGLNIGF